jgi:hypothetical protein
MKYLISIAINKRMICLFWLALQFQLFAQIRNITINSKLNDDKSIDIEYEKELPGSYYIVIEFSDISNCFTNEYKGVVTGYSGRLLNLKPINAQQGIGYSLKYSSVMGVPNPKVDSLFQYTLPFKIGKKNKIYEAGNIGEKYFGSEKPANWKSYVVSFKSPDTIFSMRKGIVVKLTNEYDDDASTTKIYTSKRNSIIIEHEDGTFAEYKGFKKNSFKVKLGQIVYPQTQLGTIELFNKSENNYRFDFCIYYLFGLSFFDNNDTEKKVTRVYTSNDGSRYKYLTPNFLTSEGATSIESKKEYTGFINETILLQEMTRSEKKKYLKDPTPFK